MLHNSVLVADYHFDVEYHKQASIYLPIYIEQCIGGYFSLTCGVFPSIIQIPIQHSSVLVADYYFDVKYYNQASIYLPIHRAVYWWLFFIDLWSIPFEYSNTNTTWQCTGG